MKVPILTALTLHDTFASGRTNPMLLDAMDGNEHRHEVVLKIFSDEEGGTGAAIVELVCSLIAKELGLRPPDPYIVEIPDEFTALMTRDQASKIGSNPGPYFASLYIPGVSVVSPDRPITSSKEEEAAAIFTFDYLVQNSDRRIEKPNLLEHDEGYYLIDHDQALSHLIRPVIGGAVDPWDKRSIVSSGYKYMKTHLFRKGLKGKEQMFQAFRDSMESFDPALLDVILDQVPQDWWDALEIRDDIAAYLENIPTQAQSISILAQCHLEK